MHVGKNDVQNWEVKFVDYLTVELLLAGDIAIY